MSVQDLAEILTVVLPSATAIIAILVPFYIEKKRTESVLKLKQIEILYDKKLEIYKEFADTYGCIHEDHSLDDYQKFRGAANKAAVVSEVQCRKAIFNLLDKVDYFNGNTNQDTDMKFQDCISMIYRQIVQDESRVKIFKRPDGGEHSQKLPEDPNLSA